jgi:hypothetical protein
VPISTRLLYTLVEIWARRGEPETADLQRAVRAGEILENDLSSPIHLRAFAWRLVTETHRAVRWELPSDVSLASCRAAADSLIHATSLLATDVSSQLRGVGTPVLILGGSADSRAVFGRWDLIPSNGATLVSLEGDDQGHPSLIDLPTAGGVRWASAGNQRQLYEENSVPVSLNGEQVLVPRPEMVAARVAHRDVKTDDPAALLFCAAVLSVGDWDEVLRIAKRLGRSAAPIEAALALGLAPSLGLRIGPVWRRLHALRRFLRR